MKATFLVDNALRETLVNTCIGILLKSVGISYELDNYNFFYSAFGYDFLRRTSEKSDVMMLPSYNVKRTPEQLSRAMRSEARMVATHAEQIINPALYEEKLNTKFKSKYNRHIVAHFVWGSFFSDLLINQSDIAPEKIYITGNPKLQVSTNLNSQNIVDNPQNKTVLIVSDFSLGDMDEKQWSKFKKNYHADYKSAINHDYYVARQELIDWLNDAASKFKDVNFRMRIHPGEDKNAYSLLNQSSNISVVGDSDFTDDLLNANLVFSYSSTSLFEALVMDKQVFNLNLHELPEERKGKYFELFEWINKNEFINIIEKISNGITFKPSNERKELLQKYMYGGNDKSLLRNAIAIKDVLDTRKTNYNLSDQITNIKNVVLSQLKDKLVRSAVLLENKTKTDNYISSFARNRNQADVGNPVRLSNAKIETTLTRALEIISQEEIDIIQKGKYEIRKTEEGIYIDF
ncbi:glycosyltransferase family protein [Marinoscillum furvescens]|uniref:Surface carbohydrate biosynthesis protein n=1 Tax=Marinoscillum furvescens DSM 4134 TaxID=1122208 RepID=A0A3D9L820_MARFU|nr:hypothetical protein [Marinoscillum furvescens]REE01635.1 surface carbohydrate biosynthesis protein [Marinoscillum furvescens DSM 4134]